MSDIWIPYGGGADLDPVTATAADVRKGKTIVDKDGNPIGGTMLDIAGRTITPTTSQVSRGGLLETVNCTATVITPQGLRQVHTPMSLYLTAARLP